LAHPSQYLDATDRTDRQRLAREWLDAGGKEMMEQAFRDGLRPLKVRADEQAVGTLRPPAHCGCEEARFLTIHKHFLMECPSLPRARTDQNAQTARPRRP
jgi:hypothetical protein